MPDPKDDPKSSEWRPYIFARDQWHCRICGDRFLYSEMASDRRPASVIRTRATSIGRPPATMRSVFAVASPARIRSTSMSTMKPCVGSIASVMPSRLPASNSRARRRLGLGPRLRREFMCERMDGRHDQDDDGRTITEPPGAD
jgi:hypothetical protein